MFIWRLVAAVFVILSDSLSTIELFPGSIFGLVWLVVDNLRGPCSGTRKKDVTARQLSAMPFAG